MLLSGTHGAPPSVDGERLPGDEGGGVGGEEGDRLGHLGDVAHAAHGVGRLAVLQEGLVP